MSNGTQGQLQRSVHAECNAAAPLTRSSSEQLLGGVVGRTGSNVALQTAELTMKQGAQQVSGRPQHHPSLHRVPAQGQTGKQRQLDVVQRLKQVEDLGQGDITGVSAGSTENFLFQGDTITSLNYEPACFSDILNCVLNL